MLRITQLTEPNGAVRLRLDGTLSQDSFEELAAMCRSCDSTDAPPITLDMSGVVFMSNDAAIKLAALRSERVSLINCSAFIEMLIENVPGANQRMPETSKRK